jgi:hypothetical protein
MSVIDVAKTVFINWLTSTLQSSRRGALATESERARRGGEGFGRIATGWLKVRGGLLEAERLRRVEADGSCTWTGDWGVYVYVGGETGGRTSCSLIGDGMAWAITGECVAEPVLEDVTELVLLRRLLPCES